MKCAIINEKLLQLLIYGTIAIAKIIVKSQLELLLLIRDLPELLLLIGKKSIYQLL